MKVNYSVGTTLGGTGIGNTAYQAVLGIQKAGCLNKVYCLNSKNVKIPKDKIKSLGPLIYLLWYPLKGIQRYIIKRFNPYAILDKVYDILTSWRIGKSDIFHSWLGHSKRSMEMVRKLGAITIVECASSFPSTQRKLVQEEYNKWGEQTLVSSNKQIKEAIHELYKSDYVTIPSDFVEKSFIENGFPKEKLIKIPFGIDLKKFNTKKEKKDNKFRAIFVGSVQLRKGIQYLLQAWEELKLKDAELIIVGRVWGDAENIVSKYRKNKTIKFIGFAEPKKYYSKSDVFVFPSIEEGSALVTYEAMASGLPLITTFNSGSIARNGKEGFILPIRDIKTLKAKIKYMYDNPKKAIQMGVAARKHVENFTWERYGENLVKAYERVLKR